MCHWCANLTKMFSASFFVFLDISLLTHEDMKRFLFRDRNLWTFSRWQLCSASACERQAPGDYSFSLPLCCPGMENPCLFIPMPCPYISTCLKMPGAAAAFLCLTAWRIKVSVHSLYQSEGDVQVYGFNRILLLCFGRLAVVALQSVLRVCLQVNCDLQSHRLIDGRCVNHAYFFTFACRVWCVYVFWKQVFLLNYCQCCSLCKKSTLKS